MEAQENSEHAHLTLLDCEQIGPKKFNKLKKYLKLNSNLKQELQEKYPDAVEIINNLQKLIKKQQLEIKKLKTGLKRITNTAVASTQTEDSLQQAPKIKTLSEDITEAAEIAIRSHGFIYEETSGLYYDYNSGYYYNAENGLYYDGNNGTYMTYNSDTKSYEFYSQINISTVLQDNAAQEVTEPILKRKYHHRSKGNQNKENTANCKEKSNLEEGECSESDASVDSENALDSKSNNLEEVANLWPPCIRIIVRSSTISQTKPGSLYIITYEGGTLGREGDHSIIIPDINISKHHLKFSFNEECGNYFIVDLGSRNGTFLNGKRISPSKQESNPTKVSHGAVLQIGGTVLLCHIHSGNETCSHCEPGLLQLREETNIYSENITKSEQFKKEMLLLRKKFGICSSNTTNSHLGVGYVDRAEARRQTLGSQHHHEKTMVASLDQSIGSENKGFRLLSKMGWSQGQSLGKTANSILEPVELKSTVGTAGLGFKNIITSDISLHKQPSIWEKTQKRYKELSS